MARHQGGRWRRGAPPPAASRPRSTHASAGSRPPALASAATPRRSATTTTCPTSSTSGCSARRWPTPARCYPTADASLEEAQYDEVRPRRAQARPGAGHAAARRGLRLGRHGACTRRASTACSVARGDAVAPAGGVGAEGHRRRRALRPRRGAVPGLPRRHRGAASTPSRRSASPSTSASPTCRRTSRSCESRLAPRAGGCSTTASPDRPRTEPVRAGGFIDRYVFPDGELEARRDDRVRDAGQRLRDPARGEPARALRA